LERIELFKRWREIVEEIKKDAEKMIPDVRVYVFGSVARGDFSVGLSDIDVAIVSPSFNDRKLKLSVHDFFFEKYFSLPVEFHFLMPEEWRFYRRFIGRDYIAVR